LNLSNLNILIISTALCWGVWGIFEKKALERATYPDVLLTLYLARLINIPAACLILSVLTPGWHLGVKLMLCCLLLSLCIALATIGYTIALSKCELVYAF